MKKLPIRQLADEFGWEFDREVYRPTWRMKYPGDHQRMVVPERAILNSREAAEYLGISLNTLYRIEKGGDLQPFRTPGGHRRYEQKMLDDYLEGTRMYSSSRSDGGQ